MIRCASAKKQAFVVALDDAVNDRGLAMTSSFSNMVVFGQCMALVPSHTLRSCPQPARESGRDILPHAADAAGARRRSRLSSL